MYQKDACLSKENPLTSRYQTEYHRIVFMICRQVSLGIHGLNDGNQPPARNLGT
jgi:hypothetical protein